MPRLIVNHMVAAAGVLIVVAGNCDAQSSIAEAGIRPGVRFTSGEVTGTFSGHDFYYMLGSVRVGGAFAWHDADGSYRQGFNHRVSIAREDGSYAAASTTVDPTGPNDNRSYNVDLIARTVASAGGVQADGFAEIDDPQFLEGPGVFAGEFLLVAGTGLFASAPDSDTGLGGGAAFGSTRLTNTLVHDPLALFEFSFDTGVMAPDCVVSLSTDPRLLILDPEWDIAITGDELRRRILAAPGLGTQDGLLEDLPLFRFILDLRNDQVTTEDAFGFDATSSAAAAPIPAPGTLGLICGGLIRTRPRRRLLGRDRVCGTGWVAPR